jgi:hypothetical protein
MKIILLLLLALVSKSICSSFKDKGILSELLTRVNQYQVLKPQNYSPPFKWAEKLGLFRSDIRINLVGNEVEAEIRNSDATGIFDNDMFSTGWILTTLFESILYGSGADTFDEKRLELAITEIEDYHNKNDNKEGIDIPIMTFWPQTYNSTYDIWQSTPINIRNLVLNFEDLPWAQLEKILHALKLDKLVQYLQNLLGSFNTYLNAFEIPADFDDTYLNIGLGSALFKLQDIYPNGFSIWNKNNQNQNIKVLIDHTLKYAYKPFDSNLNSNIIDPRTYFFARSFIQDAYSKNQSISLITTWIQNVDEQRVLYKEGVSMPFNVNNVDVTVCANSIYGITSATLYDINGFQKEFLNSLDFQQLYLNTTKFITWAVETNYTSRPDLALVYYPSVYNFLWYTSRTLFLIENELDNVSDLKLKGIFQEAKDYLSTAFEGAATDFLLKNVNYDEASKGTYFDDFLGLNDTNIFGKPTPSGEDRIFSTAQSINILIATWTYQNSTNKKLMWKSNVNENVKDLLKTSVNWLQQNVFNPKLKPSNAFFSGSVKSFNTLPFWYPSNFLQYINGTFVDPSQVTYFDTIINGVSGIIEKSKYDEMLQEKHFGENTPLDFPGYNIKDNFFPFWASQPYTYSSSLLAISQFNNLVF